MYLSQVFTIFLAFTINYITAIPQIDSKLLKSLEANQHANIFVTMKDGTDKILQQASTNSFASRGEKIDFIYNSLNKHADDTQAPILQLIHLQRMSVIEIQSFWITNQIYIQNADLKLVELLKSREEVSKIEEEEIIHLDDPIESSQPGPNADTQAVEWGVEKVKAPEVWVMAGGNNGTKITVGIIDSGVRGTHEALRYNYRNDGFSWFDPYRFTTSPTDGNGHGTHAGGSIFGSHGIGVAPGVQWMACKGLDNDGSGLNSAIIKCGEFMFCPTDPRGLNKDCSKAPRIVSNSWGSKGGNTFYNDVIRAWHAANIIPVFANGNEGPNCRTAGSPGDQNVISVGATTRTDALADFSSVGPTVSDSKAIKPDISAPGLLIRSASHVADNLYVSLSGTSMACPHVAGVIALLLSNNSALNFGQIKTILQNSADRNLAFSGATCGSIKDSIFPNNHFGYGRVNAVDALFGIEKEMNKSSSNNIIISWIVLTFSILSYICSSILH